MTKFGKLLVFFNLAISLTLMIWAMTSFVNRTDWSDNKGKDGQPDGELVARIARVKEKWAPVPAAESDWHDARQNLLALEERRRDSRHWYDRELAKLDQDANPKVPTQMREVVTDVTGKAVIDIDVDPNPDPDFRNPIRLKMQPATDSGTIVQGKRELKPLLARNIYDLQEKDLFAGSETKPEGLLAARTRLRKGVEDQVETITRMLGPQGLPARLQDEKAKREGVADESKTVEPLLINTAASSDFAVERDKELRARVAELEARLEELRRKLGVAGE